MLTLLSCGRPDYPRQLAVADSLCEVRPDSAEILLGKLKSQYATFSGDARWYYRLLRLKARGKAYKAFTKADTAEARVLLEHYRSGGDRHLLPQAYYYAGCVARDNGNAPMAIDLFRQAMEAMPDTTDLKMRSILNFQTGFLMLNQWLYGPAINYFKESLRLEQLRKDTAMVAFCYEKLAFAYEDKGEPNNALRYFKKAHQTAISLKDSTLESRIVASMASYYINRKDYAKADSCLRPFIKKVSNANKIAFYVMMATVCMNTGKLEDGFSYCKTILNESNGYSKRAVYQLLTKYYSIHDDVKNVAYYLALFNEYTDSVNMAEAKKIIGQTDASYNYNKYKEENTKLKAEKTLSISIGIVVITVALAIVGMLIWYIIVSKRKSDARERRWKSLQLHMRNKSEMHINEMKLKIAKLEEELEEANMRGKEQAERLMLQKEQLEIEIEIANKIKTINHTINEKITKSKIYNKVQLMARSNLVLSNTDWQEIDALINTVAPDFKYNLFSVTKISQQDYKLCLLIRMGGFSGKEIAVLLGRTDSAISKAKKKLQEKFLGENKENKSLDNFLLSL